MSPDRQGTPIELRVDSITQLFHTLDPSPFREKDLDRDAEEFIVGWASELTANEPIQIVVHLTQPTADPAAVDDLEPAFRRYFAYRASILQQEVNELFRVGRRSLAIGGSILVTCLLLARWSAGYLGSSPPELVVRESFVILGWVAIWRPLEIFLYDWRPIARRRDLYRGLAKAIVKVVGRGSTAEAQRLPQLPFGKSP